MIFFTENKLPGFKIFAFFCVFFLTGFSAAGQDIQSERISVRFSELSLLKALSTLNTNYAVPLSFDPELIPAGKKISKTFTNTPVSEILTFLLEETGLGYKVLHNEIIITPLDKISIRGRVVDAESGEDLIGATLYVPAIGQAISTNNYGFYSLTLNPGKYEIHISHVGYAMLSIVRPFFANENLVLRMDKKISELEEIQVHYTTDKDSSVLIKNGKTLNWEIERQKNYFKGESDAIKTLQMENGVTSLTEGSSYMFIRGGNKDQNLIILDEAPVYNPAHLFGLTSVFNPDALKNIQLYTGGIPANYGGRLSSVIDVRMADGDDKQLHVKGGVSLLTARASVEGPIVKEKSSFLFAARRSLTNLLSQNLQLFDLRPSYYDLNFKANYKLGINDRIFISAYGGRDQVKSANPYLNKWGNQTATLRWNHIFDPKLFFNLSAIYSNYKNELTINADADEGTNKWITGIRDATIKGDFTNYRSPGSQLQFGFSSILHLFIPGESGNELFNNIDRVSAAEHALYFSHKLTVRKDFQLSYGLRGSFFSTLSKPGNYDLDEKFNPVPINSPQNKSYFRLEPRLSAQYQLRTNGYLQFNYNRTYQYLQLLQNDELALSSLESWIPSGTNLLPQQSDFVSVNYKDHFIAGNYSVEVYYKKMRHQLELADHAQLISNTFIEADLRSGNSEAYGMEFSLSKDLKPFKGVLMYTFSKVYRTIQGINKNVKYPAGYDIPHVLKANLACQITRSLSFNSYFTFSTGRPYTPPIGYFEQKGLRVPIYGERNSSRMPNSHRLDLSFQWNPAPLQIGKRNLSNTFNVGMYNVYNHRNPLFYRIDQRNMEALSIDRQSFSGRSLALSYSLKF